MTLSSGIVLLAGGFGGPIASDTRRFEVCSARRARSVLRRRGLVSKASAICGAVTRSGSSLAFGSSFSSEFWLCWERCLFAGLASI